MTPNLSGHEQISELNGLVHMNARVYDSDIGRFLSADTVIQDPHDSQSYNRYSYVRNNPLTYTDPTGNSWWTKFRDKWVKPIVSIVVAAVIVAASGGSALGIFLAGASSGGIMTGTVQGAFKGGLFAVFSAGIAMGIGNGFESAFGLEHGATLYGSSQVGAQILRAGVHGISRAIIGLAQGSKFKSGFASGFASALFSPGASLGGRSTGGFTMRTTIASIVGGTASELGGGKFSNGAVSGAFVHMFNAEGVLKKLTFSEAREHYIENSGKQLSVLASSVDLSKVNRNIFSGIGDTQPIQLFFNGDEYSSLNDALTYGSITLVYAGQNKVGIFPDYYDFDMQSWSTSAFRNLGTIGGRILNMDPMGMGKGYGINFVGTATIGGN